MAGTIIIQLKNGLRFERTFSKLVTFSNGEGSLVIEAAAAKSAAAKTEAPAQA